MNEKAYLEIVFDEDGIGHMKMLPDRLYSVADLVALYHILNFHEQQNAGAVDQTAPASQKGDSDDPTKFVKL